MIPAPKLAVRFYRSDSEREPVRDWLRALQDGEKRAIGRDVKKVQYGWPVGMPLVRALGDGLWELRTGTGRHECRVLFALHAGQMVLLHGFVKKTRDLPGRALKLARYRQAKLGRG